MLPLEKATYRARAAASRGLGTASTGNNQIAIECEVVDHETLNGERITWIGTFASKASTDLVLDALMNMGWQGEELHELDEGCDVAKLLPTTFELVCDVEADQDGNDRLRAKYVNRIGGGKFAFEKKLEGRDLASFSASMRAAVRDARGGASKPAKAASKPANGSGGSRQPHPNAPGNSDDIPFGSCELSDEPSPLSRLLR